MHNKSIWVFIFFIMSSLPASANERLKGAEYFYLNFEKFSLSLGSSYGTHRIRSVSLSGTSMTVRYSYKNGELRGHIEHNGVFSGRYETNSSSGDFSLRFSADGTASGDWKCTSCGWITASGYLRIEK